MKRIKIKHIVWVGALGMLLGGTLVYAQGKKWPWHPVLAKAEKQLQNAKQTLEKATHDCGGHRMKAIALIEQAMQEVRDGRDYANAHPEEGRK